MQIIGFNLTKISIEREDKLDEKLDLKQNIDIDEIKKDQVSISKEDVLNIRFTFSVDYNDSKFAKLEIKGKIIIICKKEEIKSILKSWEKKNLPGNFRLFLFNFILSKCNIKALGLEDELNLPPHVQLPRLESKSNEEKEFESENDVEEQEDKEEGKEEGDNKYKKSKDKKETKEKDEFEEKSE